VDKQQKLLNHAVMKGPNNERFKLTLGCILSPSLMNSTLPLPALANPSTSAVDAPEPIPNVKHLHRKHDNDILKRLQCLGTSGCGFGG
jgi:hypothetical protein